MAYDHFPPINILVKPFITEYHCNIQVTISSRGGGQRHLGGGTKVLLTKSKGLSKISRNLRRGCEIALKYVYIISFKQI